MADGCQAAVPAALMHIGDSWLSAWVDGELTAAERHAAAAHLDACPHCTADLAGLAKVRGLVASLPVRRSPAGLLAAAAASARLAGAVGPSAGAGTVAASDTGPLTAARPHANRATQVAAGVAVLAGFLGGAAFTLGGQPLPQERVVRVPMDAFVADHLVRTGGGPVSAPVLVNGQP